jgi:2-keto-4-pentenoate hydratase
MKEYGMDRETIDAVAERFLEAERTCTAMEVPSREYPHLTARDGYEIQRTIVAKKLARGARVIGKKIGLTSRANQEVFGVHEPVYGQLLDDRLYAENLPIDTAKLIQPIIECELAFVMRRRLEGPGVTMPQVIRATEGIMPALEVGDSRMRNWIGRASVADILADSCGNAGFVVGGELHSLQGFDLRHTGMVVEHNGEIVATAATGAVMGNPAQSVAWLANKLAEFELVLGEGELVLSGALTGAIRMAAGDILKATFGSGLGAVGVKFV